jgi:hypothetical protein
LPTYGTQAVESENGRYLLVQLAAPADRASQRDSSDYDPQCDGELSEAELQQWHERFLRARELEATYPRDGIYRNDGSTQLIWPMPQRLCCCSEAFLSNDGRSVVSLHASVTCNCNYRGYALRFFHEGALITAYPDSVDWVPYWLLKFVLCRCTDNYFGERPNKPTLDDARQVFVFKLGSFSEQLEFDLLTGKRIAHRSSWPFAIVPPLVLVPLAIRAWTRQIRSKPHLLQIHNSGRRLRFTVFDLFLATTICGVMLAVAKSCDNGFIVAWTVIASVGSILARLRGTAASTWLLGAIAALYGAYVTVVVLGVLDEWFPYHAHLSGWVVYSYFACIGLAGLVGAWIAGGRCRPNLREAKEACARTE